jgi:predicted ATPase/DNA-binding SARP family transcriptional activator
MTEQLRITTLGGLSIYCGDQPVRGFVSRKVDALLVYLAANPREHPREILGELLWDDLPQSRTMSYLRTALSSLQQQLAPYLSVTRQTIAINPESNCWLDVEALEASLDAAEAEWQQRHSFSRMTVAALEQAVELYKGAFLEGFHIRDARGFEGWMILEQERLRNRVLEALYRLGTHHLERASYSSGIALITRALQLDPLAEQAHRLLMQLLAYSGQRSAALAQFESCQQILADELGVEPEEETLELYEQILAGEISVDSPIEIPQNLPTPATPFIERPGDKRHIIEQLEKDTCRLLTLIGPGGIGKTRLALEVARELLPEFRHGIYFMSFAAVEHTASIAATIANTLNYNFKGDIPLEDELIKQLQGQDILLILDSFEHLVDGADLISRILTQVPTVKILLTSRERLNLHEEWLYTVEALPVPRPNDPEAAKFASIQLFTQSISRIRPDFDVQTNLPAIIHICNLVEGMPLGIELAASWARIMSCQQIIDEIQNSLDFLTSSLRNIPERHRSLRAVFDSSWNLLNSIEQQTFRQLSVFRGGFQQDAARQITGASLMTLSALVDKSMLTLVDGRYQIHELLRQYAARQLNVHPQEESRIRAIHSDYYAAYIDERESRLTNNRLDSAYREVLPEYDNVFAAWEFALTQPEPTLIGRFLRPFYRLLDIQSRYLAGAELFQRAADTLGACVSGDNSGIQARALVLRAACLQNIARYDQAEAILNTVIPDLRKHQSLWDLRIALAALGGIVYARGEYRRAQEIFQEVFDLALETNGDPVIILLRLSDIATVLGEYEKARDIMEKALSLLKDGGGQQSRMRFMLTLGDIHCKLGNYAEAQANFQEALDISQKLKAENSGGVAQVSLGRVAYRAGQFAQARAYCMASIEIFSRIHSTWGHAFALIHLGKATKALGSYAEAARYYREALEIADRVGSPWLTTAAKRQLSRVDLALGDPPAAHQNLLESLRIALEIKAIPLAVDALTGLAEYHLAKQESEQAAELAAFVLTQPFTEAETAEDARIILTDLESRLSPEKMQDISTRAAQQTLETIATKFTR